MRRVVASEWVKLRRKGMLAPLGGIIVVTVLGTIITILTVGSNTSTKTAGGGPFGGKAGISFVQMASSHGLADALGNAGTLLGVIIMGVVAASVAGEFSAGTLRNLLVREPRRARLLLGKLLGLATAIFLAVVVAAAFAVVAGIIAASSKGIAMHAWGSGSGVGAALGAVGELVAATLGWGVLGAILAIVFRSPVIAVVVGVVYAAAAGEHNRRHRPKRESLAAGQASRRPGGRRKLHRLFDRRVLDHCHLCDRCHRGGRGPLYAPRCARMRCAGQPRAIPRPLRW